MAVQLRQGTVHNADKTVQQSSVQIDAQLILQRTMSAKAEVQAHSEPNVRHSKWVAHD